ncbi:MAG: molecular chaperone HtpG [Lentisphaerae bacterium]|nr:molecular chaperone HtpG [Lentisphaerota bacterium]
MATENLQFKAEIRELLSLVIHSVYSNKDIFLRELVANAADAIDKARFLSLTQQDMIRDWEIRIEADKDTKTLIISDNGVGMNRDELIENLGTIAHSGTKAFTEALEKAKEEGSVSAPELIGQFGVGFYSAFMAADKVTVETKKDGEAQAWKWISDGENDFSIEEVSKDAPGTRITLYLKEDFEAYLDYWRVAELIRKYSDFIEYPIRMKHTVTKDGKEEVEDSTLNTMKAIWLRPESEVTEEEYDQFYQHISMDYNKPARRISFSAEGASEFKSLLYIAGKMPMSYRMGMNKDHKQIQLYVRRVFITDNCPGLLPEYMGFVAGVVDSSDLPLNVSRETLQDNPQIARISKSIVKRVLSELDKMLTKDREAYEEFYKEFSPMIKGGVHTDFNNKEKLQDLLLFESMNSGKLMTLKEYSDAMPATQKAIYYITGDRREALEFSPQLEMFRKQGYDVLFLYEPMDEIIMDDIAKYAEKDLVSVLKGEVKFDESVQKELDEKTKKETEENKELVEFLKKTLEDKVKDVRFSSRLTESPCCLVGDDYDPSVSMQRLFKAMGQESPDVKRILELNGESPLIGALKSLYEKDPSAASLPDYAELLYDQALISEGATLPDPAKFARRTVLLMTESIQKELSAE